VTYTVDPAWIDTWNSPTTFLQDSELGSFMTIAVPPDLRAAFDAHDGQWVVVSGRFNDPAAEDCRVADGAGDHPSAKVLRAICRTSFVLSSIEATGAPS